VISILAIDSRKDKDTDTWVLAFSGDWDIYEKERAEDHFLQVLPDAPRGLIVDLSDVSLLDSSGVELLIAYFAKLQEVGTRMVLVVDHNNYLIRKFRNLGIFNNTGLVFFETIEEAKDSLSAE
jgi:anti-anti-sigma factor